MDKEHAVTVIEHITREMIYDYQVYQYEKLNKKGKPNTVSEQNNAIKPIKHFFSFLKEYDYLAGNPAGSIAYAKEPKRLPRGTLTQSEARKILHVPDTTCAIGYRDRTIMEVMYTSGIRKSEVSNLKTTDVDYHDGFLRINQGKGKKDRIVPLGKIACRYLENYIKTVRQEFIIDPFNDHLFLSQRGKRLSKNVVWEIIKKYAKSARIKKNVYPHTFRHTCATSMLQNRADIRSIQELLGHSSLDSTQVYTKITITDLKEVHARCHPREKDKE
jgi:integrase/recombinase XerD